MHFDALASDLQIREAIYSQEFKTIGRLESIGDSSSFSEWLTHTILRVCALFSVIWKIALDGQRDSAQTQAALQSIFLQRNCILSLVFCVLWNASGCKKAPRLQWSLRWLFRVSPSLKCWVSIVSMGSFLDFRYILYMRNFTKSTFFRSVNAI